MTFVDALLVTVAGFLAGIINTAIGSGSLVTYPALLLAGLPPITANVTNTVGLAPGAVAGAWAYRSELSGLRRELAVLVPVSALGAILGAALLLIIPSAAFRAIVPALILIACMLVALQPLLTRRLAEHPRRTRWGTLSVSVFAAGTYGGYFSAAQGILLLGILGLLVKADLQAQNALKCALQATVNVVAAVFFLVAGGFDLPLAACIAVGSLAGAPVGARIARALPARVFRIFVVAFGCIVAVILAI